MSGGNVDVVVVTTDRRDLVLQCLEHLTDAAIGQVTVVVNGSQDGTVEAVESGFPDAAIVALPQADSLPVTENRGAAHGQGELLLFMNDDVLATPEAVSRLTAALDADPRAVVAGGRLVNPGDLRTQEQYRPRTFPSLRIVALQVLDVERLWPSNPVTRRHWGIGLDDATTVTVEQPAGSCLMVRRDAFEAVGGFDERYWIWYEDTDLVRRLSERGHALYVPSAAFRHLGAGSVKRLTPAQVVLIRNHGLLTYCSTHFTRPARRMLGLLLLVAGLPRIVVFWRWRPDMSAAYRRLAGAALALLRGRSVPSLVDR
jgi:GT2 family glycosyltransferase